MDQDNKPIIIVYDGFIKIYMELMKLIQRFVSVKWIRNDGGFQDMKISILFF